MRQEDPGEWIEWPAESEEEQPHATGRKSRTSLVKRRPVVYAIGAMLLAAAMGGGYVYWDYAGRFQSTDDAFIAARQSALAPKVTGYITAVPVTDNEHVAVGDVIARIDDRDCRTALSGASCAGIRAAAGGTLPVAGRQGFGQRSERPAV